MIADAQEQAGTAFEPHLGGGTRLMLALEHRISAEIDRALDALARSTAAHAAWEAIQAPDKPALASIAAWGKPALDRHR